MESLVGFLYFLVVFWENLHFCYMIVKKYRPLSPHIYIPMYCMLSSLQKRCTDEEFHLVYHSQHVLSGSCRDKSNPIDFDTLWLK